MPSISIERENFILILTSLHVCAYVGHLLTHTDDVTDYPGLL